MKLFESSQSYFLRLFKEAHQITQASCRQNFPENYPKEKTEEEAEDAEDVSEL